MRATVEQVAGDFGGRSDPEVTSGAGRHGGAVESGPGGDDADFLEIEQFARLKRIARKPGPVLFLVLLLVSLVACRELLRSGALVGGALLPAPADSAELWARYLDAWHPVGVGDTSSAPPYLALVAMLASTLFGSAGLAVTVLLIASVPLAGFTAYFASRPLVESRLLRAWAAVVYAFLPATTGALAGGRIGTAVLAVLLPLMARAGIAASGLTHASGARGSWRATWAYTLLLTITTAFTPIVWPIALLLGLALLVVRRGEITAYGPRFLAQLGVPLLVLAPWSLSLLPFGFFQEAGLEYGSGSAGALDLLSVSPGGPGTVSGLMLIGVVLAALAALLRTERQFGIWTAWAVALVALVFAVLSNSSTWAGPATLVYGLALLAAAALGADGARSRVAEQSFGWRQPVAALIAFAAAAGPLLLAAGWMIGGADGPLERRDPVQVPAFVAEESGTRDQARTLVLTGDSTARVGYALVRGSGVRMGDGELAARSGENELLDKVVANLVAGSGADQADELGGFAVRYVLVHKGAPRQISRVLDATPGLSRLSQQEGGALWRVDRQVSRAGIVPASGSGAPQPVAAGPVDIHTTVPAGSGSRVLRLADSFDEAWTATLDGKPLTPTTLDGWAQGFELPSSGGKLDVTFDTPIGHTAWLWTQGALAVVLVVMALPGRRRDVDDDLPEEEREIPAQATTGEGRRARRLRAQAEADQTEQADEQAEFPSATPPPEEAPAAIPQQQPYGDEWNTAAYAGTQYEGYSADQYQNAQQYPPGTYDPAYQGDPYQSGQYDPYAYGGSPQTTAYDQTYTQGYDPAYDPAQPPQPHPQQPHPQDERPDGSQQ